MGGSWAVQDEGFPVIYRNGVGTPGEEVSLSKGSEVLGMTYLGPVALQAPGLSSSDPAEQNWAS